jgi:hypothetical protein
LQFATDPDSQTNADPDPNSGQNFMSIKVEFLNEKYALIGNRSKVKNIP